MTLLIETELEEFRVIIAETGQRTKRDLLHVYKAYAKILKPIRRNK